MQYQDNAYQCEACGKVGVKLWRKHTNLCNPENLLCAACLCKNTGVPLENMDANGEYHKEGKFSSTFRVSCIDKVFVYIPAVISTNSGDFIDTKPKDKKQWESLPLT